MEVDPRDRITQTAFQITPDLLGVELASPWRRAAALGIDLVLAATVVETGGGALAGLAAAVLFVLAAMRTPSRSRARRVGRGALVGLGALILFGVATDLATDTQAEFRRAETRPESPTESDRQIEALPDEALAESDTSDSNTSDVDDSAEDERAEQTAVVRDLQAYANALTARDTLAADTLRGGVVEGVAGRELADRDARIEELRERERRLARERERLQTEVESPSFLRSMLALAGDFGLKLGWIGIYFTLTLAVWRGYSPGKRALGIRVVRLDGQPLGLWTAFERFGGYAAGLATGLLGFAQVFWDANRQGVQDKIAGTVVVRMRNATTPRQRGHPDVD